MKKLFTVLSSSHHVWWRSPRLHSDESEEGERKATWLELFYDLVYVAVIAQLSHRLSAHVSAWEFLKYSFLFLPMWWAWIGGTFYNERFEVDDVRHRFFTFLQMIPIAVMAYAIHGAFEDTSEIYAISYASVRLIILYMWFRAGRDQDEATRKMTERFSIGFLISFGIWLGSVFVPAPGLFIMWGVALLVDLATPMTTVKLQSQMPQFTKSHLPERFGLFTILAIAETVIGTVNGAMHVHPLGIRQGLMAVAGLLMAFAIWWVYFDHIMARPFKQSTSIIFAWAYLHLPLVIGITAIGAATVNFVSSKSINVEEANLWLMCSSVAFVLFVMGLIGALAETHNHDKALTFRRNLNRHYLLAKVITAGLALALGALGHMVNSLLLLFLLVLLVSAQGVQGLFVTVEAYQQSKA